MTTSDAPQAIDLEQCLKDIYADQVVSNIEFQQLRDEADKTFASLHVRFAGNGYLVQFQDMADAAVQTMQQGLLSIRKEKPTEQDKLLARQAFAFQVAYIKACLDRFIQTL